MSAPGLDIIQLIRERQNPELYQDLHWEGSFNDYLDLVREKPQLARNSFQRLYDMIMSFGTSRYTEYKKEITHFSFFDDPIGNGMKENARGPARAAWSGWSLWLSALPCD